MQRWRSSSLGLIALVVGLTGAISPAFSQAPAEASRPAAAAGPPKITRPGLFFKEEWKQTPQGGEHAATPESVGNPNLELKLYVPSGDMELTGSANDENNPTHVWTGMCTSPCAAAFRDKASFADLTGLGRLRWNTKMSGFHQVRPIVKLADGTWLVGDRADGSTRDWLVSEISFADLRWLKLDIARVVTTGTFLDKVDLSKVDEIGFADLMPSSGHGPGGWSDVAQVEVYGKAVPRVAAH
ncbi:MAG: hypothetical protein WDO68_08310 [Gammaproteobacteria bacterium]